jgi:cob(I)alamin adenosyltransferase
MSEGLVYIFTGEGKGKTSAAIGTAVRAVGAGMKVGWVSWYKQESWKLSELKPLRKLGVEVWLMGEGFYIGKGDPSIVVKHAVSRRTQDDSLDLLSISSESTKGDVKMAKAGRDGVVVDGASQGEHVKAAREAMKKARELVGKVDMLVLDEVNNAAGDRLIKLIELTKLIEDRGKTHLILTGRGVAPEVVKLADLVTECKKVKHPYDKGKLAVRGVDF